MPEHHNCGEHLNWRCANFHHWIENNGFIDLGLFGPEFTWSRGTNPETRKYARLDRALCNRQWSTYFPEASVQHLLQNQSDHCPLPIIPNGFVHTKEFKGPLDFKQPSYHMISSRSAYGTTGTFICPYTLYSILFQMLWKSGIKKCLGTCLEGEKNYGQEFKASKDNWLSVTIIFYKTWGEPKVWTG